MMKHEQITCQSVQKKWQKGEKENNKRECATKRMEKILIRVYKKLYEKSGLKFAICLRLTFGKIQKHLKLNELRFVPSRSYDGLFLIQSFLS